MALMIAGHATADGTTRYLERFAGRVPAEQFRELAGGARASSIGIGTYLGREDAATDALYRRRSPAPSTSASTCSTRR